MRYAPSRCPSVSTLMPCCSLPLPTGRGQAARMRLDGSGTTRLLRSVSVRQAMLARSTLSAFLLRGQAKLDCCSGSSPQSVGRG